MTLTDDLREAMSSRRSYTMAELVEVTNEPRGHVCKSLQVMRAGREIVVMSEVFTTDSGYRRGRNRYRMKGVES